MIFSNFQKKSLYFLTDLTIFQRMIRSYTKYHQQSNVITFLLHQSQAIEILLFDEIHKYFKRCIIKPGQINGLLGMLYKDNNAAFYDQLIKENSVFEIIAESSDLYLNFRIKYFKGFYQGHERLYCEKYSKQEDENDQQVKPKQLQLQQKHSFNFHIQKKQKIMDEIFQKLSLMNEQQIVSQFTYVKSGQTWLVNKNSSLLLQLPQKACQRRYDQAKHQRSVQLQMNFNQYHEEGTQPRYYLALGFIPKSSVHQIIQIFDKKKTISVQIEFNKINTSLYSNVEVNSQNQNIHELQSISVSVILNNIQNKIQVYYRLNNQQLNILEKELTEQDHLGFDMLVPYIYLKESFIHFQMNWFEE